MLAVSKLAVADLVGTIYFLCVAGYDRRAKKAQLSSAQNCTICSTVTVFASLFSMYNPLYAIFAMLLNRIKLELNSAHSLYTPVYASLGKAWQC